MARGIFRSLLLRFATIVLPLLLAYFGFNFLVVERRQQDVLRQEAFSQAFSLTRNLAVNGAHARESAGDYLLGPLARSASAPVRWALFTDERGRPLAQSGTLPQPLPAAISRCLVSGLEQSESDGSLLVACVPMES